MGKVSSKWTGELAYAIGLITSDGSLSIDRRHINFTSKDRVLVQTFKESLGIENRIGRKARGYEREKKYYQVQFGDVLFYQFLVSLGLTPNKSKTIAALAIPDRHFFDFLRGHFDGDGTFYSYWDPRWKSSFMFYTVFISASMAHLLWLRAQLHRFLDVKGHITYGEKRNAYHLKYAKAESLKILPKLYEHPAPCLLRKRLKIQKALSIIDTTILSAGAVTGSQARLRA